MYTLRSLVVLALLSGLSCSPVGTMSTQKTPLSKVHKSGEWPRDLAACLGQMVTLEGTAVDCKLGPQLNGQGAEVIWIEGPNGLRAWNWPNGFYKGGDRGKRLRVRGLVIERHDLPILGLPCTNEVSCALECPEGMTPYEASHRYLLANVEWIILEE